MLQPTVSLLVTKDLPFSALGIWLHPRCSRGQSKIQKNIWMFGFNNTWYNNDDDSNNNYMSDYIYKMLCTLIIISKLEL